MYASDYLETGFLNVLRGNTFTAPAKCYLALFLNDPGETGAAGTEMQYPGYARMVIDFSEPADTNGGVGIKNLSDITFAAPASPVGTVTHIAVMDSLVGGNMLARGELTENLVIGANEPPVFLAGDILFYLTGSMSKAYKTRLLNIFRGVSISGITPHFSLWNGSPEASGSELAGDNYARAPLTFAAPSEQASGQMLMSNAGVVTFNRPSTPWGVWNWSAIYSAASGGEPVYLQQLTESITIKKGYMPTIDVGALKVGLN